MLRISVAIMIMLASVMAQEAGGGISGRVHDPSGAAVAGATVTAVKEETGESRKTVSNNEGVWSFPNLPIGRYEITASQAGFKKEVLRGIVLHVSDRLDVNVKLEIGAMSTQVVVEDSAERVQTESADQGALISGEQVRDLQLNGRSFMTLLELVPGVTSNMTDRMDPNSSPNVSVNGGRSTSLNINMDGGNNSDVIVGGSAQNTFVSVESIAEFTAVTSPYSAEYGRAGFAQINVVTRGGTKKYHGSVYEFFRNDKLDANDYFSHRVLPLRLNNFGYSFGGPLPFLTNRREPKTFIFINQEFNRIRACQSAINTTVPTAAMKRGDFSGFSTAIVDPSNNNLPFPDRLIPSSRLDANAVKILTLYPDPNFVGAGTINYTSAYASRQDWRQEVVRVDHNFSERFKMYGRIIVDSTYVRNPYGGSGMSGAYTPFPGLGETQSDRPGANVVVNASNVVNDTTINQMNFSYGRRYFDMFARAGQATKSALGLTIPELYPENDGGVIPVISLSNYAAINVRGAGHKELYTLEFSDTVSKIAGKHVLKAGFYTQYGANREQKFAPNTNGTFGFGTGFAKNAVANLLLGLPSNYSEVDKTAWNDIRFSSYEAFVQDDFKVTPRLTLNFGFRYAAYMAPYDLDNVFTNFIPSQWKAADAPRLDASGLLVAGTGNALNGTVQAGVNSPYDRKITGNAPAVLTPRFGFAWAPFRDNKTSIRGGYGIFSTRPMLGVYEDAGLSNPPFSNTVTLLNPLLEDLTAGTKSTVAPGSLIMLGLPMRATMVQQMSLGVQRELVRNTRLEVSYVHTHATRLMRPVNINVPQAGVLGASPGNRLNAYRPYVGYSTISNRETSGSSVYDGLQASFTRRVSSLTMGVAYTYSKSIDDGSSERGGGDMPPNKDNIRAERAVSDGSRGQVFTANFIWQAPQMARGRFNNAAFRPILNGWQLSGITRLWSGNPLDILLSYDIAGIGATQNQRPNVVGSLEGPRTPNQWFNTGAFGLPAVGTFGNLGRNAVQGPGVNKWDLALFKSFRFSESWNMQFRGEYFNVFNHPSFTSIGATLTATATTINPATGNFGVVTATRDARVAQLSLKLTF